MVGPVCLLVQNLYLIFFSFMYNLLVGGLIFDHNTKGYFSPGSGQLNPEVIRKTVHDQSRPFTEAVCREKS